MSLRGVVFDMDGVLFDTEKIYDEAWLEAARRLRIPNIEPAIIACKGVNGAFARAYFATDYPQVDYDAFERIASECFEEIVEARGLPEKPGLHEILDFLQGAGIPVALATSTGRERCLRHLAKSGVEPYFRAVVAGDQVAHGKPAPDIYLAACAALGLNPADCVAVEDSYNGIRSAHAAGLRAVMVPDLLPPTEEMRDLAWRVLDSLNDLATALEKELGGAAGADILCLTAEQITPAMFEGFDRTQIVRRCWRKQSGVWQLKDVAFEEHWGEADFARLSEELGQVARSGGAVFAALESGRMRGFAAVDSRRFGSRGQYLQLTDLHVSAESRGRGLGRALFARACAAARALGAETLYISAHSSEETQAFYRRMGCVEALEYEPHLTALEPCDCQLEYVL